MYELFYGQGKIKPTDLPLIAIMIDPGDKFRSGDDPENDSSQVSRIRGRTDLVIDHFDGFFFSHQPDHGLYKVISEFGVDPGGTDNDRVFIILQGQLLTFQFGSTIYIDRTGRIAFFQGDSGMTVEYIIGRDMNKACPHALTGNSQ